MEAKQKVPERDGKGRIKGVKGNQNFLGGCKALNRLGWKIGMCSCVGLRLLGAAVSC